MTDAVPGSARDGSWSRAGGAQRSRRLRTIKERVIFSALVGCGAFSVLVTFSIILVLFRESLGFFGVHGDDTPGAPNVLVRSAEGAPAVAQPSGLILNEIRVRMPDGGDEQFVEIAGPPRGSLEGVSYVVLGRGEGGSGSGVVELALDLSGRTLNRRGFLVAGSGRRVLGARAQLVLPGRLPAEQNSTHLLVRGFIGAPGDDLDIENDGLLSSRPWDELIDSCALVESSASSDGEGGAVYSAQVIGPLNDDEIPTLAYRDPMGDHSWRLSAGESIRVSFGEFVTGLRWNPLLGHDRHFGIWPLISGTLLVTGIAALIAIPLGLITAIFLSEYAPRGLRAVLKPVLEILAGIPTVVYGFFALTVITPWLELVAQWLIGSRIGKWLGETTGWWGPEDQIFESFNAASAGIAVGIMCLPIVTSLSEDALQSVPRHLREGAYAVGGTKFDVSTKVVVPAALSGVIGAFLLAIARAVGETMAVTLAAGGTAKLTLDPTSSVQTMTAWMVQMFLGDASNFGPEYRSAYAVATVLFVMTFMITLLGARVLRRYREVYE